MSTNYSIKTVIPILKVMDGTGAGFEPEAHQHVSKNKYFLEVVDIHEIEVKSESFETPKKTATLFNFDMIQNWELLGHILRSHRHKNN